MNFRLDNYLKSKGVNIYNSNEIPLKSRDNFYVFNNKFINDVGLMQNHKITNKIKQYGGKIHNFDVETNYEVDITIEVNENYSELYDVHIIVTSEPSIECGFISIDKKSKKASIYNLQNEKSCIKCLNPNSRYKVGDILMQVMLNLAFNKYDVSQIVLTDNSIYNCNKYTLDLSILRILTHGEPYYVKFGFYPKYDIGKIYYAHNKNLFNQHPTLSKTETFNILFKIVLTDDKYDKCIKYISEKILPTINHNYTKFYPLIQQIIENNVIFKNNKITKYIINNSLFCEKYVIPLVNNNEVSELIKKLLNITFNLIPDEKKYLCKIIHDFSLVAFKKLGYINDTYNTNSIVVDEKTRENNPNFYIIKKNDYINVINNKILNKSKLSVK